ncbi:nucleotidyltransferase family protein [Grimontia marina]|uniref:Purine catabolism protein PucB n=1 Tax=Grimontia marina TaxID=646534 RepID=A0A128FJY8_9GAMM|nr:nucleotidyltransferase family protein [Grimontia marina]CZF86566.1 Purine catabolism protein PucB [Grimontia marina]
MIKLAAVILAAGRASRFQECKALAEINGSPIISFPINAAVTVTQDIFIATGFWHKELEAACKENHWPAKTLYIGKWKEGIGSVISSVTEKLESDYSAILFMLADQPAISTDNIELLWKVFKEHINDAVCCQYHDTVGVPAIASKTMFEELKTLKGDEGAKHLLNNGKHMVNVVAIDQCNIDIDTQEDLDNYIHYLNHMASLW